MVLVGSALSVRPIIFALDTSGKDMSFTDYSLYNELNRNSKVNPIDTNTEEIHLIILCTKPEQWQVVDPNELMNKKIRLSHHKKPIQQHLIT